MLTSGTQVLVLLSMSDSLSMEKLDFLAQFSQDPIMSCPVIAGTSSVLNFLSAMYNGLRIEPSMDPL
jgi:hypothetical protein